MPPFSGAYRQSAKAYRFVAPFLASFACVFVAFSVSAQSDAGVSDAGASEAGSVPGAEARGTKLHPPHLVRAVAPEYPRNRIDEGGHPSVIVAIELDKEGRIVEVTIEHSAGEDFDRAAIAAVMQWEFEPARRGDEPVASQIHATVHFELPIIDETKDAHAQHDHRSRLEAPPKKEKATPQKAPKLSKTKKPKSASRPEAAFGAKALVTGDGRATRRGASDLTIDGDLLRVSPRSEGAEILRTVPGLYVGRGEGDAVGHRLSLRGFDADHGQDLELRLNHIPLNMPSHIHGQGYADLGFLIAEVVSSMDVREGVYDPQQGDFAVAGSIRFDLGVKGRGLRLKTHYGSFNTFRQLALFAPENMSNETFVAGQVRTSDGFGSGRQSQGGTILAQLGVPIGDWKLKILGALHGVRAGLAGVLRQDDIDGGRVGYFGRYPYPTAQHQNGSSLRLMLGVSALHFDRSGARSDVGVWYVHDTFRLQENFTGYLQRSRTLENVVGRGDLIEQQNGDNAFGLNARYRSQRHRLLGSWLQPAVELGVEGRVDLIDQQQRLIEGGRNEVWDERVDAGVTAMDLAIYGDVDSRMGDCRKLLGSCVIVRTGLRADVLSYGIDDALANRPPPTRSPDSTIVGYRRSALGIALNPRLSAALPFEWDGHRASVMVAYGQGFRSPQARTLEDGERAPFTRVHSADIGVRYDFSEVKKKPVDPGVRFLESQAAAISSVTGKVFSPGQFFLHRTFG